TPGGSWSGSSTPGLSPDSGSWKQVLAMGVTLVNRQSSLRGPGKPSSPKRAMALRRRRCTAGPLGNSASVSLNAVREALTAEGACKVAVVMASSSTDRRGGAVLDAERLVALLLQEQGQLLAARPHDPALGQDVDVVGDDVVEQSLVVGDDQHGPLGAAQ